MSKTRTRRRGKKAYESTSVTIARTREQIDTLLRKWGVKGVQWEDNFDDGVSTLRFRWENDAGYEFRARYKLELESDDQVREKAIDLRNKMFSENKYDRLLRERGKAEHRLLLNFLKNVFEAVDSGVIVAEAVFLPWIEDAEGVTLYERIKPAMSQLGTKSLSKALAAGSEED